MLKKINLEQIYPMETIAGVWLQPTVQSHCLITTVQND